MLTKLRLNRNCQLCVGSLYCKGPTKARPKAPILPLEQNMTLEGGVNLTVENARVHAAYCAAPALGSN